MKYELFSWTTLMLYLYQQGNDKNYKFMTLLKLTSTASRDDRVNTGLNTLSRVVNTQLDILTYYLLLNSISNSRYQLSSSQSLRIGQTGRTPTGKKWKWEVEMERQNLN